MGKTKLNRDEFTKIAAMTYLLEQRLSQVVRDIGWQAHINKRKITKEEYERVSNMVDELGMVMHYLEQEIKLMQKGESNDSNST